MNTYSVNETVGKNRLLERFVVNDDKNFPITPNNESTAAKSLANIDVNDGSVAGDVSLTLASLIFYHRHDLKPSVFNSLLYYYNYVPINRIYMILGDLVYKTSLVSYIFQKTSAVFVGSEERPQLTTIVQFFWRYHSNFFLSENATKFEIDDEKDV